MSKYPVVIGRFEYVDLIDVLNHVPCKIDTGAYGSSIHASDINEVEVKGVKVLKFKLLGHPTHPDQIAHEARSFRVRQIKSSNGHVSTRYEISLKIRLGYKVFTTPFTLIDRSENVFPILIGRKALNERFLVDSSKTGVNRVELKLLAANASVDEEDLEGVNT